MNDMGISVPEQVKNQRAITRAGRPSKLTPEVQKIIVDAVRGGNYLETSATLAGVGKETFYDWLRRGARAKSGKFKEFSDTIKRAVGESEARDLSIIDKAADGWDSIKRKAVTRKNAKGEMEVIEQTVEQTREFQWTAAAWRLERKFPQKWGRRDFVEVSGDQENPVFVRQPEESYSGKQIVAFMIALADVNLIPKEMLQMIDVTPTPDLTPPVVNGNGAANGYKNGNGSNGSGTP